MCKIFLDDVRQPKDCIGYMYTRIGPLNPIYLEEWLVVKNYDEFVNAITNRIDEITHISFDHDLADEHYDPTMYDDDFRHNEMYSSFKEKTGYDCAEWMIKFYKEKQKEMPIIIVHSMNPVGVQNILRLFL